MLLLLISCNFVYDKRQQALKKSRTTPPNKVVPAAGDAEGSEDAVAASPRAAPQQHQELEQDMSPLVLTTTPRVQSRATLSTLLLYLSKPSSSHA